MKSITKTIRNLALAALFFTVQHINSQCSVSFTYTIGLNGSVSFYAVSNPSISSGGGISWGFGNNTYSYVTSPSVTCNYTANGTYTVSAGYVSNTCTSTAVWQVITITNYCGLNAGFSQWPSPSGYTSFLNNSVGTTTATTYSWDFGDNSPLNNAVSPAHTYSSSGTYTVSLTANNNSTPTCIDVQTNTITISQTCTLVPSFSYSINGGVVNFFNTTTSTSATSYTWNLGNSVWSTSVQPTTTYTANGVYTVVLSAASASNFGCYGQYTQTISITNAATCNINSNFNHSNGSNGTVFFNNTSTGTVPGTTYLWLFGDNSPNSTQTNATHTYSANGTYMAKLIANNNFSTSCVDSISVPVVVNSICNLAASFNYTIGNNGLVNFANTSTGTLATTSYTWSFGNSTFSYNLSNVNTSATYIANGTYTVMLYAVQNSTLGCTSTATQVITITNSNPCALNALLLIGAGPSGYFTFLNASTGTTSATTYTLDFGDGSPTGTLGTQVAHTYTANGTYTVSLTANNNGTFACTNVYTLALVVSTNCSLTAAFNYSIGNNGLVTFTNTTTAPNSTVSVSYFWDFGNSTSSSIINPSISYIANGVYVVTLTANIWTYSCSSVAVQTIVINNIPTCSLNAGFSYTVGSSGQVNFTNLSTGTNSTTTYSWNYGDGWSSSSTNPSHTYINAGVHYVTLYVTNSAPVFCIDSVNVGVNVTGIACQANSNFTLQPTNTPQYWYAIPSYPWNVTNAVWNWGDNTTSNGIYSSHQYSVAGSYNICLSVTVSCSSTSSSCATYSVFRSASNIINVQVTAPLLVDEITGIANEHLDNTGFSVVPNPNNGLFNLSVKNLVLAETRVSVYNVMGQRIYENTFSAGNVEIEQPLDLSAQPSGIYVVEITNGKNRTSKKLVISH